MRKLRDIAFVIVVAVFIGCPMAVMCAEKVSPGIEDVVTTLDTSILEGADDRGTIRKHLTPDGYITRKLQSACEKAVEKVIPRRAQVLYANAGLQRTAIGVANTPFRFPCYEAFYGCDMLYDPGENSILSQPAARTDQFMERLQAFAEGVEEIAARHPEKRFVVYLVQGMYSSDVNPAAALSANTVSAEEAIDAFQTAFKSSNAVFCTDSYADFDEYYEQFYRSDHHWNLRGAQQAYNTMAAALGSEQADCKIEEGDEIFEGSSARKALAHVSDRIVIDDGQAFSNLVVVSDGERQPYSHDAYLDEPSENVKLYNFYELYYNFISAGSTIENPQGEGASLLVTDSFGGAIQQIIAEGYGRTHVLRHAQAQKGRAGIDKDTRLEDIPEFQDAHDVYFVGSCGDLALIAGRAPLYFK